ncbi:hypothetical protein DF018_13485 [Burkholderia cenocepacia]|nr:hypothetical protein DF018_13485 [Burkholderia cenocepacia]
MLTDPGQLSEKKYAFVVLALDGASLSSDEGRMLLAKVGHAIRQRGTVLIVGSIGFGMRELAIRAGSLDGEKVLCGRLGLLCHKVSPDFMPVHDSLSRSDLVRADFAMRHLNDGCFAIEDRTVAAHEFARLFDRSAIARCFVVPPEQFALESRAMFPLFALSEILGWPAVDALTENVALWSLTVEAVRAIQGLNEHGEAGKKAAAELTGQTLIAMWEHIEQASLPLNWQQFNAYQHGKRVKAADKLLLQDCINAGTQEGHDMSAVRKILQMWR